MHCFSRETWYLLIHMIFFLLKATLELWTFCSSLTLGALSRDQEKKQAQNFVNIYFMTQQ